MAQRGCVVLLGDFSHERLDLTSIERDSCWSVAYIPDLDGLRQMAQTCRVTAVLIQAGSMDLSWRQAMREIRAVAPRARVIVCHRGEQANYRTEMADSGAFGVLLSPLAQSEVRQSLGFIWASRVKAVNKVVSSAGKIRPLDISQHVGAA